jgi:hypothetical protein
MAPLLWAPDPAGQLFDWQQAARDHAAIVAGDEQARSRLRCSIAFARPRP